MGAVERLAERRARVVMAHPRDPVLAKWFSGNESVAGVHVDADTAITYDPVLAAGRYITETVAGLPLPLFERTSQGKKRAEDHPAYEVLHDQPNAFQTAFEFREMGGWHLLLRGNAYAEIIPNGPSFSLIPRHPDRVTPFWAPDGSRAYSYADPFLNRSRIILAGEMLHVMFMPKDGLAGVSVIEYAREQIGAGLAGQLFQGRVFKNSARPGGVLSHPKTLSQEARTRLRAEWEERYKGAENADRVALLEEGLSFTSIGWSPADAELVEQLRQNRRATAAVFRVPPYKIGDFESATFGSVEALSIEAVRESISPWLVRWQQSIRRDVLKPRGWQKRYFAEFVDGALLRGDLQSRYQAYAVGRQNGFLSANDIRDLENLNRIEGGDVYLRPLNMVPADQDVDPPAAGEPIPGGSPNPAGSGPGPDTPAPQRSTRELRAIQGRARTQRAFAPLFEEHARRVLKREIAAVDREFRRQAASRSISEFLDWLDAFYGDDFRASVLREMNPVFLSFASAMRDAAAEEINAEPESIDVSSFAFALAGGYATRHAGESLAGIREIVSSGEPATIAPTLAERFETWQSDRPARIAAREVVQAGNAVVRETYKRGGITRIRWATSPNACEICSALDGVVVGIEEAFAGGEPVGGQSKSITPRRTLHPPIHDGCSCSVIPG